MARAGYDMQELGLDVILHGTEIVRCETCGNEDPVLYWIDDLMRSVAGA